MKWGNFGCPITREYSDMDIIETIEKPWRNPVDYAMLAFWVMIFVIVAFAMYDTLRILTMWIKSAVD